MFNEISNTTEVWLHHDPALLRAAVEVFGVSGLEVADADNGATVIPLWSDEQVIRSLCFGLVNALMANPELRAAFL